MAELDDRNPGHCGCLLAEITPRRANLWGEEVYFNVPLQMEDDNPSPTASAGDISYWSPGAYVLHMI
jgi:hypothetical protein